MFVPSLNAVGLWALCLASLLCGALVLADDQQCSSEADKASVAADKASDFANYFVSYGYISHQKRMLSDKVRMRAYSNAIMQNKKAFEGKVVLDVGAGSGVLSIWAAQAGAAKVYAVEYTDMAHFARKNVEKNGFKDVIKVFQSSVEELELPSKVDIIISEWMGYFLLRESMLDSVIVARDRWLNAGGLMFPSHASMQIAAITNENDRRANEGQLQSTLGEWEQFAYEMQGLYNFDVTAITDAYVEEQEAYYLHSSAWIELRYEHVVGKPLEIKHLDLTTCTLADAEGVTETAFEAVVPYGTTVSGFAGWFTVDFHGSEANPLEHKVTLSTAPEIGYTHWGQQVFYFPEAIEAAQGTKLHGTVSMTRQVKNKRMYSFGMQLSVDDSGPLEKLHFEIP